MDADGQQEQEEYALPPELRDAYLGPVLLRERLLQALELKIALDVWRPREKEAGDAT